MDSEKIESGVRMILEGIGEDPEREGLLETPARVARAYVEICGGYEQDPKPILKRVFSEKRDEMVIVQGIRVTSLCEHHLMSFVGHCHIGYIPSGKVLGLSKFARLVNVYARRLQVQERLTDEIAGALMEHLQPQGAAVVIKAEHMCMTARGVKEHAPITTTSCMKGVFLDNKKNSKEEFFSLLSMPT